jgi:hypothetical protein
MTNRQLDRFAPLLQVPPASRGEPRGRGTPRFARGTGRVARLSPLREGNREGVRGFPRFARETEPRACSVPPACRGNLKEGVHKKYD